MDNYTPIHLAGNELFSDEDFRILVAGRDAGLRRVSEPIQRFDQRIVIEPL